MTTEIAVSSPTLEMARATLELACDDLDDAVRSLSETDGVDTVMASPHLVALLVKAVNARHQVRWLELVVAAETADRHWLATRQ